MFKREEGHSFSMRSRRYSVESDFFEQTYIKSRSKTEVELKELFCDEDYKSIQRMLSFIIASFVLISTVTNFFVTLNAYAKVSDNANQINFLFDNWQAGYISDIITLKNRYHWPDGFETLVRRVWPGTVEGCDCTHAITEDKQLHVGKCTAKQISQKCKQFPMTGPMPLQDFLGRLIWIK